MKDLDHITIVVENGRIYLETDLSLVELTVGEAALLAEKLQLAMEAVGSD